MLKEDVKDSKKNQQAALRLTQAIDGLRQAGALEFLILGLLTRTTYYTQQNNHTAAWQDLNETFEIASFGEMKLYLCGYHLEVCRNLNVQFVQKISNQHITNQHADGKS